MLAVIILKTIQVVGTAKMGGTAACMQRVRYLEAKDVKGDWRLPIEANMSLV